MRLGFILVLCILFSGSLIAQENITLEKAINIALNKNTTIKKMEHNVESRESATRTSYGALLPNVSAGAGWSYTQREIAGGTFNYGGFIVDEPATTSYTRNYSAEVSARTTLFDGLSNYAYISQTSNDLESAKLALNRAKQDIVFYTITSYYDVIQKREILMVREDDLKWNQKQLEIISTKQELGAVTMADLYQQQVKVGNAELMLINAQNSFETAKGDILYYLGLNANGDYSFEDEKLAHAELTKLTSTIESLNVSLDELIENALVNRPDLKSQERKLEGSRDGVTMAFGGHLPSITNSISYSYSSSVVDELFDNSTLYIGLSLNVPIFSGWSTSNRVQQAEIQVKNDEADLDDLQRKIKKDLQKTYLDMQAAQKSLEVTDKNVLSASEKRKIEEERYSLGSTTLLEVLIANAEYTQAQTDYINAQFNYLILKEQIDYYLGIIDFSQFE